MIDNNKSLKDKALSLQHRFDELLIQKGFTLEQIIAIQWCISESVDEDAARAGLPTVRIQRGSTARCDERANLM